MSGSTLAVIPARGGSKGVPGKNLRLLAGLPLLEHSIRLAKLCPEITRTIVSTDSDDIAAVARASGAEIPFKRPSELGRDETHMWPVVRHALGTVEGEYEFLLLLDPTSPGRLPSDVSNAHRLLRNRPDADGVIAVSEPSFSPIWHSVVESGGLIEWLFGEAQSYGRRQDVPRTLRINGALYLWRSEFVRGEQESWLGGRHMPLEIPDERAFHLDSEAGFRLAEIVLGQGLVTLPWLGSP